MPSRKQLAARDQEIVELYQTTLRPLADIGAQFGITYQRVSQILAREGINVRKTAAQCRADRIVELAKNGSSREKIAEQIGIRSDSVRLTLAAHGLVVPIRHAQMLTPDDTRTLRRMYGHVPVYNNHGRAVCTSPEGRALVEYVLQLRREGHSLASLMETLGLTVQAGQLWLRHYGFSKEPHPAAPVDDPH